MSPVLIDTSALVAFLDADDPRHTDVVDAFRELERDTRVTHGYVMAESIAVVRRRLGVDAVIALLDDVLPTMDLLPVDGERLDEARRRYRSSLPSGVSFVDQVSLVVIEIEGIDTVLALDPDLARPGIRLVPPAAG